MNRNSYVLYKCCGIIIIPFQNNKNYKPDPVKLDMTINWEGSGISEKGYDGRGNCIVQVDQRYHRPAEVDALLGDARRAREQLGWHSTVSFSELVREMVESDLRNAERDALSNQHGYVTYKRHEE